jgi:hypothetical protein
MIDLTVISVAVNTEHTGFITIHSSDKKTVFLSIQLRDSYPGAIGGFECFGHLHLFFIRDVFVPLYL